MQRVSPEGCVRMSQAIQSEDVCRGDEVEAVSGRGNAHFGPQRVFLFLFFFPATVAAAAAAAAREEDVLELNG